MGCRRVMAHTYVILSNTATGKDDTAILTGTVDGIPVTVIYNLSALAKFATAIQAFNFIAPLMLSQAFPASQVVSVLPSGTFVQ
jgi:hypothetical protein